MDVKHITPILNVTSLLETFAWFEKLGWQKGWDWRPEGADPGSEPLFGSVLNGKGIRLFLCRDGQGGRGKSDLEHTSGPEGNDHSERGMWMAVWVDDVDAVYDVCQREGIEITMSPRDEPWGTREMHIRHPDGHVFRVSQDLMPPA